MKFKEFLFVIFCILLLFFVIYLGNSSSPQKGVNNNQPINNNQNNNMALNISSTAFQNNGDIPSKYTCDGENVSPPILIEGVNPNAKSLVLIMDDPDAPSGTFDHWIKYNIDPTTTNIEGGKEPLGVSGKSSFGKITYGGPCPGNGTHHYHFKLYSLDETLALPEGASKKEVEAAMTGHILQESELIGLYQRVK